MRRGKRPRMVRPLQATCKGDRRDLQHQRLFRSGGTMLDAAIKALAQMFTPPFRSILLRSVGLAIIFLIVLGIGVYKVLAWLTGAGETWAESTLGTDSHWPLLVLAKLLAIAFSLGIVVGG